jgi:NAD+ synthase
MEKKIENYKNYLINWIRDWFEENGNECKAIVGISGGKDSTVVAALCVEALGKDRVVGVLMPNGTQKDISDSYEVVKHLGIRHICVNIADSYNAILNQFDGNGLVESEQTKINLAPRLRMATLYAVSQSLNGRVVGTSNLDESVLGYFTRWGDGVADVEPIINLHVSEVVELGLLLGLPEHLVKKTPSDGLCGLSDEDKIGFTYKEFQNFYELMNGDVINPIIGYEMTDKEIHMMKLVRENLFKNRPIPSPNKSLTDF